MRRRELGVSVLVIEQYVTGVAQAHLDCAGGAQRLDLPVGKLDDDPEGATRHTTRRTRRCALRATMRRVAFLCTQRRTTLGRMISCRRRVVGRTRFQRVSLQASNSMNVVRNASIQEIESLLIDLGKGNHPDNMRSLRRFSRYFLVELSESEGLSLVFLQNDHVLQICPRGEDRRLRAVAARANKIGPVKLHDNWDLGEVLRRTEMELSAKPLRQLVLRDAVETEREFGRWYIQDGSHSALGYALALLSGRAYVPVRAFCATNETFS